MNAGFFFNEFCHFIVKNICTLQRFLFKINRKK